MSLKRYIDSDDIEGLSNYLKTRKIPAVKDIIQDALNRRTQRVTNPLCHNVFRMILLYCHILDLFEWAFDNECVSLDIVRVLYDDSFWREKMQLDFPACYTGTLPSWSQGTGKNVIKFRDLPWRRVYSITYYTSKNEVYPDLCTQMETRTNFKYDDVNISLKLEDYTASGIVVEYYHPNNEEIYGSHSTTFENVWKHFGSGLEYPSFPYTDFVELECEGGYICFPP